MKAFRNIAEIIVLVPVFIVAMVVFIVGTAIAAVIEFIRNGRVL